MITAFEFLSIKSYRQHNLYTFNLKKNIIYL
jgi:hypothetical protein